MMNAVINTPEIKQQGKHRFIDEGKGYPLVLVHGLFGALSNWGTVVEEFSKQYRVLVPMLPIYEIPVRKAGMDSLTAYLEEFVDDMALDRFAIIGNSLGGHIGLIYVLAHPGRISHLVLTGSSGLFENSMGSSFPKRGNYQFVKERVEHTFYDSGVVTKDYVDEIFNIVTNIPRCMSIVAIAKSAQRNNMANDVVNIKTPTLLVWGLNDTITPPVVGHEFNRLIPTSTLHFIDKCCHVPMMEHPDKFNQLVFNFLKEHEN